MTAIIEKIMMHPYWGQTHHIVALFFVIFSLTTIFVSILSCVRKIERCRVKVEAEIIDSRLCTGRDSEGKNYRYYVPKYQYFYEGMTYTLEARRESSGSPYPLGKRVKLYIDPEYPSQFAERKAEIGNAAGWALCSLPFLVIGALMLLTDEADM